MKSAGERHEAAGGSAFPVNTVASQETGSYQPESGMTLRDYFAAKAMNAIIIGNGADICCTGRDGARGMASDAYIVADAMLKAREVLE